MKAIIYIDVQNDFIDGVLGVDKTHEISERILNYAKGNRFDAISIATRDTHFKNLYKSSLEGQKLPVPHCIAGTVGWDLYENLEDIVDYTINKPTFGSRNLISLIEKLNTDCFLPNDCALPNGGNMPSKVENIEICGFCTSICVISNALMLRAAFPDMKITILENLCGDINEESHKAALTVARNCQIDVVTVDL